MEGCKLHEMANSNSIIAPLVQIINDTLKGLIRECPVSVLKVENGSFSFNNPAIQRMKQLQALPNGDYKIIIHYYNLQDENIYHIVIFYVIKFREQTLNMDEEI